MVEAKSCTRWVWSSWGFHLQQLYRGWGCSPNYICGEQIWVLEMLRMLKCHIGDVTQFWHPKFMENDVFRSPHEFQVTNCFDIPTHTLEQGSNIQFQDVSGNYPYLHWFINSKKPQPPQPHPIYQPSPLFEETPRRKNLHEGEADSKPGGPSEATVRNQRETSAESLPGHGSSSCSTVSRAKVWGVVDFLGLKS